MKEKIEAFNYMTGRWDVVGEVAKISIPKYGAILDEDGKPLPQVKKGEKIKITP